MQVNINHTESIDSNDEENERLADEVLKPVEEKLLSTNWKVRKSAYTEIIDEVKVISEKASGPARSIEIEQYLEKIQLFYEKILEEGNPSSLETGLDLILIILRNDDNISELNKQEIFRLTIEKAYSCSKTVTKEKSKEILVTILQKSNDTKLQFEILKKVLEYPIKKIKLIMLAEQILQFLFSEYGCKTVDFKFFMPTVAKLIQSTNHGIKYEALEILKEIYRQVRSDIIPFLREVKDSMIKELRNNFDKIDDLEPDPKMVLKEFSQLETACSETVPVNNVVIETVENNENNPTKVEVNIISNNNNISSSNLNVMIPRRSSSIVCLEGKREMYLHEVYNDDIVDSLLSREKKWMDKKEILDEFTKSLSNCKIIYTDSLADYENLFYVFRQLLKDTNINIVQSTLNTINYLSIQFGKPFAVYAKEYLPWILEKFKEKKDKLNKEIITTLSSFLKYNLTLDEVVPILCDVASDVSNQYKLNISEFMLITLRKTYLSILKEAAIDLIDLFDKLSDEQNTEIKNTALNCLALIKVRLYDYVKDEGLMDEINESKQVKIDEFTKMINYDKSYDLETPQNRFESPLPKNVKKSPGEKNLDADDSIKFNKFTLEKDELAVVEPKSKVEKISKAPIDIPVETKTERLNSFDDVVIVTKVEKNKVPPTEAPIDTRNHNDSDLMEIPIGTKKNQQQADLEEFERKLEEAMKKENEKRDEGGQVIKKAPAKKPASNVNKKPAAATPIANDNANKANNDDDDDNSKMNKDEVEEKINSLVGSEAATLLMSTKWDEKKNGLIMLNEWITENTNSNSSLIQNNVENLVIFLKIKLKDFKEMNFNLVKEAMNIYIHLISNFSGKGFDKKFTLSILRAFAEKIADVKLKESMFNLLYAMMENQGPKFIQTNILKIIEKKAPSNNALKEYAAFFEKAIDDFGIGLTPVKDMVELCKTMAANTNPQVRNASTNLLCVLYKFVGKDIRTLLKDIKESTLKVIESELDKITVLDASAINSLPKRQLKATALKEEGLMTTSAAGKSSNNKNPQAQIMDSLIPRSDISKKITPKLLKDINDGKWQEKKEAVENLEKILTDANMKILPTGLNELFGMIKARLSDGNKNVVRLVVNLLNKLIDCLGSPFKTFTKPLSTPLLNNLSDKAQLLREDVMVCMDKWVTHCGLDSIIIYIPPILHKQDNFEMRSELLKFLHKYKESFVFIKDKMDLKEFVPSMLSCLQDKTISIRNSADEMTAYLLRFVPLSAFMNGLKDYKQAIANTLKIMLEKYKGLNMDEPLEQNVGNSSLTLNNKYNRSGEAKKDNSDNSLTPKKIKKEETHGDNKITIKSKAESANNVNQNSAGPNSNLNVIKIGKNTKGNDNHNNNQGDKEKNGKKSKNDDNQKNNQGIMSPSPGSKKSSNNNINLHNYNSVFIPGQTSKNAKDKRLEIDKRYKFNLDTINEDFENKLKDQLKLVVTTEILEKLFHQDLKQNIDGITIITNIIKENGLLNSGMFDNLDLILKWVGFKSYNNQNPLLIKLVIEFCDNLIEKIGENELNLNETEGYILVAVLVDKLSNNNTKLKEICKLLLEKSLTYITAKISTLVSSSAGKNSKIKIDCIDMCTELVSTLGFNIAPQKDIRAIAKMLNTNDNNLKLSIVKFLGVIYTEIKDSLWNILNDLPEKTKELLYTKFNQMGLVPVEGSNDDSITEQTNESDNEEEYQPYAHKNSTDNSFKDISQKTTVNVSQSSIASNHNNINSKTNVFVNPNNMYLLKNSDSIPSMPFKNKAEFNEESVNQSFILNSQKLNSSAHHTNLGINPALVVENITDRNELIQILNNLNSGEISERVNTILIIHELIFTRFTQTKHILIPNIDIIIKSFILALKILFQNKNPYDIPLKLGKYLLTVLYKISSNKELIKNISYNVLFELSEEVLTNLLIENLDKVGENQEGLIIVRSLNSTMLRILENCNYTEVITILLELVRRYRTHDIKSKISGLAIKCLLKINQILDQIIQNIEVDKILIKIHELLIDFDTSNPDLEVKNQTDQMVIRYVKNLINELVKLKKDSIVNDYLKGVEMHRVKDKYIKRWIRNVLLSMSDNKSQSSNKVNTTYSNINTMSANTSRQPSSNDNMAAYKNKKSRSPVVNHSRKSLKGRSPSDSNSPMRSSRNSVMYDKIINLKSKLANFNNNSISVNKPGAISSKKTLNNTCIIGSPSVYEMTEETSQRNFNMDNKTRYENSNLNNSVISGTTKTSTNQPIMSKINELKKKWNEVSSKNKNSSNVPSSPARLDKNKSIDESLIFASNTNSTDIRIVEDRSRYIATKLKNQPGKK